MIDRSQLTVDDAISVLNRDYREDVLGIVAEVKRAVKGGEVSSEDELRDYLHETVGGSARVIYTFQARLGLISSDNHDACEEQTGERPPSPEVAMYWALLADVEDGLGDVSELFESDDEGEEP